MARIAPSRATMIAWGLQFAPDAARAARRLYGQGRFRQLAILHARTIVDGTFSWEMAAGERVWVVWTGDLIVATYPEVAGTTDGLFIGARPERRQDPDDVVVRRVRRRVSAMPRPSIPTRMRRTDTSPSGADAGSSSDETAPPST